MPAVGHRGRNEWARRDERIGTPIAQNEWVRVVATFGSDAMRVHTNGALAVEVPMDSWYDSGNILLHWTTSFLYGNDHTLRVGADLAETGFPAEGRSNGYLDDIPYFHRALTLAEVQHLFSLGSCADVPAGG